MGCDIKDGPVIKLEGGSVDNPLVSNASFPFEKSVEVPLVANDSFD